MEIVEPVISTTDKAKEIKAIDRSSVHKICSGQVVLTLAVAVKELLENAIDAGATTVEIRLKNNGCDLIEVIDNGQGVEEHNFQALTLKHHTSKIQDFNDLISVTTFGFRGEALSSLCALSKLSVTTRHKSAECAYKILYDTNGKIMSKTRCARSIGTTVVLENLFSTLSVRHKEFQRNIKREYTKMCNLLYAYCLIATGVKIVCTNTTNKNMKSIIVSTQENNTVKDNISCIFGHEQFSSIIEFEQIEPTPEVCTEYNIKDENVQIPFTIIGFISYCKPGSGRGTSDRQFYYINSRPCEINKLTRLVNDVYHQFNNSQYPFVLLNIKVNTSMVDVNVTPDKRKLFMENENLLLATIKSSLLNMFRKNITCFDTSNLNIKDDGIKRGIKRNNQEESQMSMKSFVMRTLLQKRMKIDDDKVENLSEISSDEEIEVKEKKKTTIQDDLSKNVIEISGCDVKLEKIKERIVPVEKASEKNIKIEFPACTSHSLIEKENLIDTGKIDKIEQTQKLTTDPTITVQEIKTNSIVKKESTLSNLEKDEQEVIHESDSNSLHEEEEEEEEEPHKPDSTDAKDSYKIIEFSQSNNKIIDDMNLEDCSPNDIDTEQKELENQNNENQSKIENKINEDETEDLQYDCTQIPTRDKISANITLKDLKNRLLEKQKCQQKSNEVNIKFRAEINPLSNQNAEKELEREIKKDTFKKMDIIGQFNMGFIIAKLENDLFIIDQHATDEKYNYEILQETTIMQRQKLVVPQKLELTTANKALIVDNMEIFNKNGFMFNIEDSENTQNIYLTEVPLSKNFCMGKDDIDDLLFMLQDGSQQMCRPTRIRSMLALRACRKSVMVGDPLSKQDMRKLIDHMGEIDHPWNCPHGRPTMRHLVNLSLMNCEDS
ncbi:mismatch repair endonuclease PMS2 [Chrysoperla carnea]|uniref:mismatch repair endonuclease PMS2 n=1 Tax=Chrysoperla carnea TaxID=189513 RepID=UPI001D087216|nr:mismatch repair endonuclease PMS2 [Chrysoperla carnea]